MPSALDPATAPEPLLAALLLAAAAGLLDAVTYLLHGHVFATAVTGNAVLLGMTVLNGNAASILLHAAPMVGYIGGVLASKWLRTVAGRWADPMGLGVEAVLLVVAGLLPGRFPEMAFTAGIGFVSAIQVAGYRHVGPYSYNSTFLTGDLRDMAEGFFDWIWPRGEAGVRARGRTRMTDLSLVVLCFVAGASGGALASHPLGNHAYWIPVPVLVGMAPLSLRWVEREPKPEGAPAEVLPSNGASTAKGGVR